MEVWDKSKKYLFRYPTQIMLMKWVKRKICIILYVFSPRICIVPLFLCLTRTMVFENYYQRGFICYFGPCNHFLSYKNEILFPFYRWQNSGFSKARWLVHSPGSELWKGAPFSWPVPLPGCGLAHRVQSRFQSTHPWLSKFVCAPATACGSSDSRARKWQNWNLHSHLPDLDPSFVPPCLPL